MAHDQIHPGIWNFRPALCTKQLAVRCEPGQTPLSHSPCTHERFNAQKSCRPEPLLQQLEKAAAVAADVEHRGVRRHASIRLYMAGERTPEMDVALFQTLVFFMIEEVGADDL